MYGVKPERTVFLGNLLAGQEVKREDNDVGEDVAGADTVEDERIIKGNLLGDLHHAEHDDEVGSVGRIVSSVFQLRSRISGRRRGTYTWGFMVKVCGEISCSGEKLEEDEHGGVGADVGDER